MLHVFELGPNQSGVCRRCSVHVRLTETGYGRCAITVCSWISGPFLSFLLIMRISPLSRSPPSPPRQQQTSQEGVEETPELYLGGHHRRYFQAHRSAIARRRGGGGGVCCCPVIVRTGGRSCLVRCLESDGFVLPEDMLHRVIFRSICLLVSIGLDVCVCDCVYERASACSTDFERLSICGFFKKIIVLLGTIYPNHLYLY